MIFPPGREAVRKMEMSATQRHNAPQEGQAELSFCREIPADGLEWYIIQLLWRKSFVECEQIGFWCGKESFFSVKIKNTSCVLQSVVLVCISVKIGCFGGFCRKMYLFPPCENQILPISIFGF